MSQLPMFRDIEMSIGGETIPVLDFHLPAPGPDLDDPYLLTTFTTTNIEVKGDLTMTEEQEEELSKWWAERMQREFERQLFGHPSEYSESLRAAKAKV